MAISKAFVASILISLLVLQLVQAIEANHEASNSVSDDTDIKKIDCGGACKERCKLSSRPNLCNRACGTCCARCNCVPAGTYGNYESCACYANMTTRGNKKKCP